METSLFVFHKDLRLNDNRGLKAALETKKKVIPCFIFSPKDTPSPRFLTFLLESIEDLQKDLQKAGGKLFLFYGLKEKVIEKCIEELNVKELILNKNFLPQEAKLNQQIEKICKQKQVTFQIIDDALLHPPEETLKKDGAPYTVFTPYFKNSLKLPIDLPQSVREKNYYTKSIDFENGHAFMKTLPRAHNTICGGREAALKILKHLEKFKPYAKKRDYPSEHATTNLSPYLNFGCISSRELYDQVKKHLGKDHELIRALYWRDFFTQIGYFFPHVFTESFHKKYNRLKWSYDKKAFKAWCEGKTGVPIVDAGMRELNETGLMHNRVRMIVASFLVKDLHINWQEGEKYFGEKLIDFDPSINNGNWQWAASTGCDAQPYFRIFNPWLQQKKFDPECLYIKEWVEELQNVPCKEIHQGLATSPIIDHAKESKIALKLYKSVQL